MLSALWGTCPGVKPPSHQVCPPSPSHSHQQHMRIQFPRVLTDLRSSRSFCNCLLLYLCLTAILVCMMTDCILVGSWEQGRIFPELVSTQDEESPRGHRPVLRRRCLRGQSLRQRSEKSGLDSSKKSSGPQTSLCAAFLPR